MLITNPIPEAYAMDDGVINGAIDQAVAEAEEQGIRGKEITPFLLARVAELTGGDSLASNIQLVYNNARLASELRRPTPGWQKKKRPRNKNNQPKSTE